MGRNNNYKAFFEKHFYFSGYSSGGFVLRKEMMELCKQDDVPFDGLYPWLMQIPWIEYKRMETGMVFKGFVKR